MAGKKKKGKNGEPKKPKPRKAKMDGGGGVAAGGGGGRVSSTRCQVDIFAEVAMENAYTTCHNVQDLLKWRGFPWPDAQKKKKKGKK